MTRQKMRDRFPDDAVTLRCPCGKSLGLAWETNCRTGSTADCALLVHHKVGRMYRTKQTDGRKMVFVANDDNDATIYCTACDRVWRSTRDCMLALVRKARGANEKIAYLENLTPDEVAAALRPTMTRRVEPHSEHWDQLRTSRNW